MKLIESVMDSLQCSERAAKDEVEHLPPWAIEMLNQVTAQRDELQAEVIRLDGELLDVRGRCDELLAASKVAIQWLQKANGSSVFQNCALPLGGVNAERQLHAAITKAEQH